MIQETAVRKDRDWEVLRAEGRFDDAIVEFVRSYGSGVSFAEIDDRFRTYVDTPDAPRQSLIELDRTICKNMVLWVTTPALARILTTLLNERRLWPAPCSFLIYMFDGTSLDLPLAKRKTNYAKQHWLPATLSLEKPSARNSKRRKR